MASLELIKSASALIVNMAPVVREVCSAVGSDQLVPDDYFAPYAIDSIYQGVERSLQFKGTAQTTGGYLGRFDPLRREAGSRTQMAGSSPEAFVSILRMQNAPLPRPDKSLASASAQGDSGVTPAARRTRGQFGPIGGAVRQDALAATEWSVNSSDDGFAAWVAHRKAKNNLPDKDWASGSKQKAGGAKGAGETLYGINHETGERGRRYLRNSGHHLLPKCPQHCALSRNSAPVASP